jgi:hypothetical protein
MTILILMFSIVHNFYIMTLLLELHTFILSEPNLERIVGMKHLSTCGLGLGNSDGTKFKDVTLQ